MTWIDIYLYKYAETRWRDCKDCLDGTFRKLENGLDTSIKSFHLFVQACIHTLIRNGLYYNGYYTVRDWVMWKLAHGFSKFKQG